MKINSIYILLIAIISLNFADSNIETKQKSLNEIESEINNLENELKKQEQSQKTTNQQLEQIKSKIVIEIKKLTATQNQEQKKFQIFQSTKHIVDSLKNNSIIIQNKKNEIIQLVTLVKKENKLLTNQIILLNDSLIQVKNKLDNTSQILKNIKKEIKLIIKETILIKPPSDIEFIIESETWNNFILRSTMYEILIKQKNDKIQSLFNQKEIIKQKYNQDLNMQNKIIQDKKNIADQIKKYEQKTNRLNNNLEIVEKLLLTKKQILKEVEDEYKKLSFDANVSEEKIVNLKNEKKQIQNSQKKTYKEKKRIEHSLILKKQSRNKVEKEINKLLTQKSEYKGSNIAKLKNQLPWPIEGDLITKFGINVSQTGAKFDYTFIEIVGDEILHLTNEINPKKPNKSLVKKFQKITMGLKKGDIGYGVFGPRTTKEWQKYNQIQINNTKQPILAIHEGKIEEIKFIDPITGVLVIIRHNDESFSTYSGHIDLIIEKNDLVNKKQKIGFIKKEDVLAFQLLIDGKVVNPQNWLNKK